MCPLTSTNGQRSQTSAGGKCYFRVIAHTWKGLFFSLRSFYTGVKINELGQSITLEPMSFESLSVVSSQETTVQRQTKDKL